MDNNYFFSLDSISAGYDGKAVIDKVSVELKPGEIMCLVGPNGAGKTTLLKTIIGQLKAIAGNIYISGDNLLDIARAELSKKQAIVLTDRIKSEFLTVEDIVNTGRHPYTGKMGLLSEADRVVVRESMEAADVLDIRDQDFMRLSDGQRQRVMIARAIAQEPSLLVLDEPTAYLDIRYKLELLHLIKSLAKDKRITVIISMHEIELTRLVADKVLCVKDGGVYKLGTPNDLFVPGFVEELYNIDIEGFPREYEKYISSYTIPLNF